MPSSQRINWLSILRGLTICLVVMNHVRLQDPATGQCYPLIFTINGLFAPLRMPTFVMVSGALLYHTRIRKNWAVPALYRDKLIRIGLPLIFCTILGNLMQMAFNAFVKHPHPVSFTSFLQSFVIYPGMPWPHRWYLMTLLTLMLLYPLYRALSSRTASIIALLILFPISLIDFSIDGVPNWCHIFTLNQYLPYFLLGITVFRFGWWKCLTSAITAFVLTFLYILLYVFRLGGQPIELIATYIPLFPLLGVSALVSLCIQIDRYLPRLCHTFRAYIFQIYLFGIAFQAFVELILWPRTGQPQALAPVFYILNILAGIYLPVLMAKVVERIPSRFLQLCFGLSPKSPNSEKAGAHKN